MRITCVGVSAAMPKRSINCWDLASLWKVDFDMTRKNLILLCEQFFQVWVLDGVPFRSVHAAVIGDARTQEFFDIEWGMAVIDIRQDLGCLVRCDVAFEAGG